MGFLVPLTLFGWIPFVLFLFAVLPPRRAVIWAFMLAWLFLPMAGYKIPSLPDYTKMSATVFGVLMGAALFDTDRLLSFRPRWVDIPVFIYCLSPAVSSYLNNLGLYDGASEIVRQFIIWGLPYMIGRVYFNDLESLRELAISLFLGGLVYVPFCWLEVRLSPQLHVWMYGFRQHAFIQQMRDGGYRPMVFMQHGLMVAMWMGMTSLIGVWLWKSRTLRQVWGQPMYLLVPAMIFTVYLCKSKYAALLFATGIGALYVSTWLKTRWIMVALLMVAPTYMWLRADGIVTGEQMIHAAEGAFGEDRAKSLAVRVNNENALAERAMQQPWFGWGGWGGYRVVDENGKDRVTDSLWIITLGKAGWVNLIGLTAMLLLPMLLVCFDWKVELWSHPAVAPVVVLGMMCALYMFDHLMNGMVNPIFMLATGAVSAAHFAALPKTQRAAGPQTMGRPIGYGNAAFGAQPVTPQSFRPA